jgi:hypothetical protein
MESMGKTYRRVRDQRLPRDLAKLRSAIGGRAEESYNAGVDAGPAKRIVDDVLADAGVDARVCNRCAPPPPWPPRSRGSPSLWAEVHRVGTVAKPRGDALRLDESRRPGMVDGP